jgi:hypothetical protein
MVMWVTLSQMCCARGFGLPYPDINGKRREAEHHRKPVQVTQKSIEALCYNFRIKELPEHKTNRYPVSTSLQQWSPMVPSLADCGRRWSPIAADLNEPRKQLSQLK